ncbi:hypothetical protein ACOMHN_020434 [Nucella lapillus]
MLLLLCLAVVGMTMAGPFGRQLEKPDCAQQPNGVVWTGGCGSFGVCQNEQYSQIDCANGTVVNTQSLQCVPPGNAPFPCNLPPRDCSAHIKSPGYRLPLTQPDPDSGRPPCSVYYTCTYGNFLPFQWCPEGTVYDELNQRCNDPLTVAPPCGRGIGNDDDHQVLNGQYIPRQNQLNQYNRNQDRNNQNQYGNNPNQNGNNPFGQNPNSQNQDEVDQYDQFQSRQSKDLYGQVNQKRYGRSNQNRNPYLTNQGGDRGW